MNFKWINPNSSGKIDVAIAEYGITFYAGAIEDMGNPEYVLLGMDEDDKVLGVKPCSKDEAKAIPFKEKFNEKGNFIRISNKTIIRYIENKMDGDLTIDKKAQKYNTKWDKEGNVLLVYLKQPIE